MWLTLPTVETSVLKVGHDSVQEYEPFAAPISVPLPRLLLTERQSSQTVVTAVIRHGIKSAGQHVAVDF